MNPAQALHLPALFQHGPTQRVLRFLLAIDEINVRLESRSLVRGFEFAGPPASTDYIVVPRAVMPEARLWFNRIHFSRSTVL